MKNAVLGKKYVLELIFVGDAKAQRLNKLYRGKTYVPNVLSFPLSLTHGEIFMNLRVARKQAPSHRMKEGDFIAFLFIHSLFHLKGYDHGSRMERGEEKVLKKFKVNFS
ncbi:MAG: rRNA maturation RNase YbeY [Patescibacteria group bacterium]